MTQLTKNFSREELACPHCGKCEMDAEFLQVIQDLRDYCGFALTINSGYRCEDHNKRVGGVRASDHKNGRAVDIDLSSLTRTHRDILMYRIGSDPRITGIGLGQNYIHISMRPGKRAMWKY